MQEIVILSIVSWWIAEGSDLIQTIKWKFKLKRLPVLDCAKCLGFWMGIGYVIFIGLSLHSLPIPILVSTGSIFISKIYERIKL